MTSTTRESRLVLLTEHFYYAITLTLLAQLYRKQARYVEAHSYFIDARSIIEKQFGLTHLFMVPILSGQATLAKQQHCYQDAKSLYENALVILKHAL